MTTKLNDLLRDWASLEEKERLKWHADSISSQFRTAAVDPLCQNGFVRMKILESPSCFGNESLRHLIQELSSELGFLVPQSYKNNLIAEIRDVGKNYSSHKTRGHQTNAKLAFHSDRCDVNVLFYIQSSSSGGELSVVSYENASALMKNKDHRLYKSLFKEFPFDLRTERVFRSIPWCMRPILWETPEGIRGHYIRRFINDSQRHKECPRLTNLQSDSLDLFDEVLESIRVKNEFLPRPGELVLLDNYRVMHARNSFTDDSIHALKERLAFRCWVAPFFSLELPCSLFPMTGSVQGGTYRGGIGNSEDYLRLLGKNSIG